MRLLSRNVLIAFLLQSSPAFCVEVTPDCCELDLWTGQGVTIGRVLLPEVNLMTAFGGSTADEGALALGHHDPDRNGVTFQNIEFSLSANFGQNAFFFATYAAKVDLDDRWADELEEYYISAGSLPLDARVKVGRFYTRFGYQNQLHPHDFLFVDQYLMNGRLLGEDSMTVLGAELKIPLWRNLPKRWSDRLVVSFGSIPDAEEEGHEEEAEAAFEGEGALFQDYLATADYTLSFAASATSEYQIGVAAAWGKNNFERHTTVYGLHGQYLWRPSPVHSHSHSPGKEVLNPGEHQHGTEVGDAHPAHDEESGEFFRWRTELVARRFGAVGGGEDRHGGEHEEQETEETGGSRRLRRDFTDAGFYTTLTYGFPQGNVQAHLRGEYVSGLIETGTTERWRVSPALSWRPRTRVPVQIKIQYNFDHSPGFEDEHSVWAQVNLAWGDCCAHDH
jgi:hypothetical protein